VSETGFNRCSRPSELKITDMRFVDLVGAPMHCTLVKIYTNQGITGVGEIRDFGTRLYGEVLKGRLLGENPCNVERLYKRIRQHAGQARQAGGVSGIEMALWDLAGKAYGVPVYQMLGGKYRDGIRMYCDVGVNNTGRMDGRRIGQVLKAHADKYGFTMVKAALSVEGVQYLHPDETVISAPLGLFQQIQHDQNLHFNFISGRHPELTNDMSRFSERNAAYAGFATEMPYTFFRVTERGLDLYEQEVAAMREELGWEMPLAIDHIGRINLEDAARLLRRLEKYNLSWVEDALPPYYVEEYKRLSQMSGVALATGEDMFGVEGFEALCRERAVPIIHPDIGSAGGIGEMKRIGDMAQKYHVAMIAHMCETPIAALATAHMGVATENFIACEFNAPDVPWWNDMVLGFGGPIIQNGFITLNDKPGLGIDDLNDEVLAEHLMPGTGGVWDETSRWDREYSNDKLFS